MFWLFHRYCNDILNSLVSFDFYFASILIFGRWLSELWVFQYFWHQLFDSFNVEWHQNYRTVNFKLPIILKYLWNYIVQCEELVKGILFGQNRIFYSLWLSVSALFDIESFECIMPADPNFKFPNSFRWYLEIFDEVENMLVAWF